MIDEIDGITIISFIDNEVLVEVEKQVNRVADQVGLTVGRGYYPKHKRPMILSVGGDGTLLTAARAALVYYDGDIPILPINTGKLGFLTNGRLNGDLEQILEHIVVDGNLPQYGMHDELLKLERRMALLGTINGVDSNGIIFDSVDFTALNEFFLACDHNEMMTYDLAINGRQIATQNGSGVLVSTSTGSTAQALSSGGAIISPNTNVMQIVPVVSHSLTSRAVIVRDRDVVTMSAKITDRCRTICVHADGHTLFRTEIPRIKTGHHAASVTVEVKEHPKNVFLIRPRNWDFFDVLSKKMGW